MGGTPKRGGGSWESPQGAWQLPTRLCSWLLGRAHSHGLGKLQALLPHSPGALKEGWELPFSTPIPATTLVIGLWLVPVP